MKTTSDLIKEVETISVDANGVRFEVDTQGEGDRLVLCLHGFPEHSIAWRFQMPYLANLGYRVWAPNMRGYGNTDAPKGLKNYQLEVLMKDVEELIEASDATEVTLLSHDWGALIAWHLAMRKPALIDRLVICNVPHPFLFWRAISRSFEQLRRSWYIFFFQLPWLPELVFSRISIGRLIRGGAANRKNYSDEVVELLNKNTSRSRNRTAMLNYYRAMLCGGGNYRQWKLGYPKIKVPTLMLWGEKDVALSMTSSMGTEDHVDNFTIRYFKGMSHHVQQDAPDEVNAMLAAFLQNNPIPEYFELMS